MAGRRTVVCPEDPACVVGAVGARGESGGRRVKYQYLVMAHHRSRVNRHQCSPADVPRSVRFILRPNNRGFSLAHRVGLSTPMADIAANCFLVFTKFQSFRYGPAVALVAADGGGKSARKERGRLQYVRILFARPREWVAVQVELRALNAGLI